MTDVTDADAWLDRFTSVELLDIACRIAEHCPTPHAEGVGALELWRKRRAEGKKENAVLTFAACREAAAYEARRDGLESVANRLFADASAAIARATAEKAKRTLSCSVNNHGAARGAA